MVLRWLIVLALSVSVKSCGISTHTEIIHRAMEFYDNPAFGPGEVRRIILDHQGAFQAGAPFPDAFYNSLCKQGELHSVSEDTHWGPYQKVAWDYFRKTYPNPIGNEKAEQLMAFLIGMASHQVADVLWHNLEGLQDGMIEMLAETTFDGDFNAAHDLADFGGDILGIVEFDTSYANKWLVPTEDILNIFIEYYGEDRGITPLLIDECAGMLFAGRLAEQELGAVLYPNFASRSAIFLDEYQEYFMGGLDDMAVWTRLVWDTSLEMAANGTEHCHIVDNPMNIHCDGEHSDDEQQSSSRKVKQDKKEKFFKDLEKNLDIKLKDFANDFLKVTKNENGIQIEAKMSEIKAKVHSTVNKDIVLQASEKAISDHAVFFTSKPYSKLGWSITTGDVNADGIDDVLFGAPGYSSIGCVFILYGSQNELIQPGEHNLEEVSDLILCGNSSDPFSRFGHDLLIQDFDYDGLVDIIVGAPTSGLKDIAYDGAVHVFLAKVTQSGEITFDQNPDLSLTPPLTSVSRSSTFGWSLAAVEDAGFLVSARHRTDNGAKQSGAVFSVKFGEEVSNVVEGRDGYQWTGSDVVALSQSVFAVGSPTWNDCSVSPCKKSAGKVDLFNVGSQEPFATIVGATEYSQLGTSILQTEILANDVLKNVLVLGSPTFSYDAGLVDNHVHAGSVQFFDLEALYSGATQEEAFLLKIDSDKSHGRFGASIHASRNHLWISAQRYHGLDATQESGSLFGFSRDSSLPLGVITDECGFFETKPCISSYANLILTPPDDEAKSLFGKSVESISASENQYLFVSAPRSSRFARSSGVVYVYKNL